MLRVSNLDNIPKKHKEKMTNWKLCDVIEVLWVYVLVGWDGSAAYCTHFVLRLEILLSLALIASLIPKIQYGTVWYCTRAKLFSKRNKVVGQIFSSNHGRSNAQNRIDNVNYNLWFCHPWKRWTMNGARRHFSTKSSSWNSLGWKQEVLFMYCRFILQS